MELNEIEVFRYLKPTEFGRVVSIQLHHFADASSYGYGACSYLRFLDHRGSVHLSFLIGKSRLAPMKSVTIPRLELTAAVLAVKLDELVRKELDLSLDSSFFWIDSTSVLYCIKNCTKEFPVFVANRLAIIESHTDIIHWHHVPSKLNPADTASRGVEANKLSCSEWLQGPSFLLQPQSEWPKSEKTSNELPSDFLPVKSQVVHVIVEPNKTDDVIERFMNHCSSLYKLKKLVAWLLRFILFFRHRAKDKAYSSTDKTLSVTELQNAENNLIRYIQHKHFPECFLNKQCKLKSLPRSFQKLQPIVVDGVLRVEGRLKQGSV